MGESSACLVRSLSQPSPTSTDEKQSNPVQRALSSSISFGRFMSESLDWEKWSTFTHNRYLEEVEKYKRPGSVAEKKAYFEARYKRRKAESLAEEENEAQIDLPQMNETKKDEGLNAKVEVERDIGSTVINQEDKTEDKGAIVGGLESSGKKKPIFSPGKFSMVKNIACSTPNSAKTIRGSSDKKRSTPRSVHQSINFDTHAQEALKASSPGQEKIVKSRPILTRSNKSKDNNAPPMLAKECFAISPQPENKSNSRSSVTRESRVQPSSMALPFVFKSEERAVKRKEFFQMLEEKKKAQDIEKNQLHAKSKEKPKINYQDLRRSIAFKAAPSKKVSAKTESSNSLVKKEEVKMDVKDLRHSVAFKGSPDIKISGKMEKEKLKTDCRDLLHSIACKVAPNGKVSDKIESTITLVKKIPKVQPCTHEFKAKVVPKFEGKESRPTWRFATKTDNSKDVVGKNNRPPIYSAKSLTKKRQHENVSPNIQP